MQVKDSTTPLLNGSSHTPPNRADEVQDLLAAVQSLLIPFIRAANDGTAATANSNGDVNGLATPGKGSRTALIDYHSPEDLVKAMNFSLPAGEGEGKQGLLHLVEDILKYSVNTWDQGFMDKLYATTNAPGVVSELVLAVLNTNLHVYHVSPALTVIEKTTARTFANLFGFEGPHAGGIVTQGGSASNFTSIILARNNLFPDTKKEGYGLKKFVLFVSAHGHYSLEKAADMSGFGVQNVWSVPVDSLGQMIPEELEKLVQRAKNEGRTPFYVSASAGTTVLGSYDPFNSIADICKKYNLWLHVDASWGGPAIFSGKQKHKLAGVERADSLAVNPHKMMGVPCTCSFLLGPDLRKFHRANTLPAGYLFHEVSGDEVWDLADLTLQCGRRGDSLKLALSWVYYGKKGYERQIDHAFDIAAYFANQVAEHRDFILISENPPPCLQVCFYFAKEGNLRATVDDNTKATKVITHELVGRGFMVDYAPGEKGSFFRVVVNRETTIQTIDRLVLTIQELGEKYEINGI